MKTSLIWPPRRFIRFVCVTLIHFIIVLSSTSLQFLLLPLRYVNTGLYMALTEYLRTYVFSLISLRALLFSPIEFVLTGAVDEIMKFHKSFGCSLLMSTHLTNSDYAFLSSLFLTSSISNVRFIAKSALFRVPFIGKLMENANDISLVRRWDDDRRTLQNAVQELRKDCERSPVLTVIFPEGTFMRTELMPKQEKFMLANSIIKPLKYHLFPRSTGIHYLVEALDGDLNCIFDVTLALPELDGNLPICNWYSELETYLEINPKEIHMHIRHFPSSEIPTEKGKFASWISERFYEKDEILQYFYKNKSFDGMDVGNTIGSDKKLLKRNFHSLPNWKLVMLGLGINIVLLKLLSLQKVIALPYLLYYCIL